MNTGNITQEALNYYRAAIKSWLTLRNVQSTSQLRLAALLDTEEKPAAYASPLENLRERLALLEWQINCAARDGLYQDHMTTEKKESCSDLNRKAHLSPASAGFFDVYSMSACLYCMKSHDFMHLHFYFSGQIRRG